MIKFSIPEQLFQHIRLTQQIYEIATENIVAIVEEPISLGTFIYFENPHTRICVDDTIQETLSKLIACSTQWTPQIYIGPKQLVGHIYIPDRALFTIPNAHAVITKRVPAYVYRNISKTTKQIFEINSIKDLKT